MLLEHPLSQLTPAYVYTYCYFGINPQECLSLALSGKCFQPRHFLSRQRLLITLSFIGMSNIRTFLMIIILSFPLQIVKTVVIFSSAFSLHRWKFRTLQQFPYNLSDLASLQTGGDLRRKYPYCWLYDNVYLACASGHPPLVISIFAYRRDFYYTYDVILLLAEVILYC